MSNPVNEPTIEQLSPRRTNWFKLGILLSTFGLLVFIGVFSYGYWQLAKINFALAQNVTDLQKDAQSNKTDVNALHDSLVNLQQAAQKSQELSAKQEQIIADWQLAQKGDLNKWYVAEAQYLVKLANDHLQFTHNTTLTMTLLQRAEQVLQNLSDPSLLEIRKSLATDIENLKAAQQVDVTTLYLRLNALNGQINQLSLPISPLQMDAKQIVATVVPQDATWWQRGLSQTQDALRKIVVIRNTDNKAVPLIMPEEKTFLYQNLHAQMEDAMWGVLHRNVDVYQASLNRAEAWIQQYFDQDAATTKNMLQALQELRQVNIQPPKGDLAATLTLFDNYFTRNTPAS